MNSQPDSKAKTTRDTPGGLIIGLSVVSLCVLVAISVGLWHYTHRKELGPTFNVDVEVEKPAGPIKAGIATRFTVLVAQDNEETPLAGRIMDLSVTPRDKASIISVSGQSGTNYAKDSPKAKGRTDAEGRLEVMVSATEPGKYTLVALDSASLKEGTINFQVAPGG